MSLWFYTILLPKAEAEAIDFSEQLSVQFNNKHRKSSKEKKMKNEWLTMPTLTKENVIFDAKLSPG